MVQLQLMWHHVLDLNRFYDSRLGAMARRVIQDRIRELWSDACGCRLLGLGYAIPYMRPFYGEAERLIAVMPAQQGAIPWPSEAPGVVVLAEDTELPLPDNSVDYALFVHAVECSERLRPMLREVWRVLVGGGRILVVVPNRHGAWAWFERTPFGLGHPFTPWHLSKLLDSCMFKPLRTASALYLPPTQSPIMLRGANAWEQLGSRWRFPFAGVLLIEAEKHAYAIAPPIKKQRPRIYPGFIGR